MVLHEVARQYQRLINRAIVIRHNFSTLNDMAYAFSQIATATSCVSAEVGNNTAFIVRVMLSDDFLGAEAISQ